MFIFCLFTNSSLLSLLLPLTILMVLKIFFSYSNFLVILLTLEFLVLTLILMITNSLNNWPAIIILLFFTMAVVEACIGLSLFISSARFSGSESIPALHFKLTKLLTFKVKITPLI